MSNVTRVGCFSHARRGFDEAIKASGKNAKDTKAKEGLRFCSKLFNLETKWKKLSAAERHKERILHSKPVLEAFLAWLHETQPGVLPKSHLGKAITYCLNQWKPLTAFLLDGRIEIDNNSAERSIKPFVIGRKNWLFSNTAKGAKASATIYSVIESAKQNNLKPFEYLEHLLNQLPNIDITDQEVLDELMPWSPTIPDRCRTPVK